MRRKFFLCLLLIGFGAFGFARENESKNPFAQAFPPSMFLFGPDFNGNLMPFFPDSALSSLMNPALGALNASRTYEGNFMLLTGKDSSILTPEDMGEQTDLFGFAVNGGVSVPTDAGVFNATGHFFYSHARSFAVRPTLGASFAYSRILLPCVRLSALRLPIRAFFPEPPWRSAAALKVFLPKTSRINSNMRWQAISA